MLLSNGRIYLMDAWNTVVDTLVVHDGRVAFAGRRSDVNVSSSEEVVDLAGRAVVPGLVDAHGHLMHLARGRLTLDAGGARSEAEVAERVAARAARMPRGAWLGGRGWDQNRWPEREWPTRASLDRAAPAHPVALTRIDGHATWANSAALAAAGIDRATSEPTGGRILLHLRHGMGGRAARPGEAPRRLRMALAARHRRHHRGRLRLPGREPEPVSWSLCRGRAAASQWRGSRVPAGA